MIIKLKIDIYSMSKHEKNGLCDKQYESAENTRYLKTIVKRRILFVRY